MISNIENGVLIRSDIGFNQIMNAALYNIEGRLVKVWDIYCK